MTTTELAPKAPEKKAPIPEGGASRLQAAEYLGVSISTIKRELREGNLAFERVRGRVVIPWAVLYARVAPAAASTDDSSAANDSPTSDKDPT